MPVLTLRVAGNRRATPTTRILEVDLGDAEFPYKAGQWARLGADAAGGKPYSIATAPHESREGRRLEFLIRVDGWGAELSRLKRGASLHVDGPHGRFCVPDAFTEPRALFVAGGTGIAPLRAMLHEVLRRPRHPDCCLLYSARSSDEFAYARELRALARDGRLRVAFTVTGSPRARWKGLSGRISAALLGDMAHGNPHTFICGPEGFVTDIKGVLEGLGVRKIRTEEQ